MKTIFFTCLLLFTCTAQSSWQACRQLADNAQRLACYDRFANSQQSTQPANPQAPVSPPDDSTGFGLPATAPAANLQAIDAHIAHIETGSRNRRILTLDNGQVWIQTGNNRHPKLAVGDAIHIERAALGSYRLTRQGSNRTLRVKRLQ